jgi:hypothetical protein
MNSKRRERFETVAGKRVQKILDSIDILSKCANRNNYDYSDQDLKKMMKAIREKLNHAESLFQNELSKNSKQVFKF